MDSRRMVSAFVRRLVVNNKAFILDQVLSVKGLMQLLMKIRNTDEPWTREEKKEIKKHLRNMSKMVPVIVIFILPGGTILLPILAEILDRRKKRRGRAGPSSPRSL